MVSQRSTRLGWITFALVTAITLVGVVTANEPGESKGSKTRAETGQFDGMAFVGETGRDGKDKGRKEKIVFAGGKFRASSFSAYGFSDAKYETTAVDGELKFTAAVVSSREGGGKMHWSGTLHGDVLEGTMRWDHGWESKLYWFRGTTKAQTTASR